MNEREKFVYLKEFVKKWVTYYIQQAKIPELGTHTHVTGGAEGGQLDHGLAMTAASLLDDDHTQYIKHSLATAISDFLVASGAGAFVKKTLAEVKSLLDWAADIATHAALTTGIHGVGASTVESVSGSQAKVDAHKDLTTGVHGVGAGTIAKTADITATKLDDFAAPDNNTDLNVSITAHGLCPILPNVSTKYLSGTGVFSVPIKIEYLKVIAETTALTTGDGKMYFTVPDSFNGMNLIDADAAVYTVSSSGTPTVQINNLDYAGGAQDMLSTPITIDASEYNSYTATAPPVINTSYDDVATGNRLRIDVDVAGTGTTGLDVILTFQLP